MKKYDLSSVRQIITGAAPLGLETAEDLQRIQPTWSILQAYGKLRWHWLVNASWALFNVT